MASNKIKFPLWLTPECKQVVEDNYRPDQCQSRSEFIEKAIWFYAGFLHTLDAGAYLPRVLKQMLDGTLGVFAERIGRQLFKLAVEQNVNNHILASDRLGRCCVGPLGRNGPFGLRRTRGRHRRRQLRSACRTFAHHLL